MATGESISDVVRPLDTGSTALEWASYVRDVTHVLVEHEPTEALRALAADPRTPEDILLELSQRPELRDDLGHRKGPRRLLESLANSYRHPEATITVAIDLYTAPNESLEAFQAFIDRHGDNTWMLESLIRCESSTPEKEQALIDAIARHPEAPRLQRVVEIARLEAEAAVTSSPKRIEELFRTNDRAVWRRLAANPNASPEVLRELAMVRNGPLAKEIRATAQSQLSKL